MTTHRGLAFSVVSHESCCVGNKIRQMDCNCAAAKVLQVSLE